MSPRATEMPVAETTERLFARLYVQANETDRYKNLLHALDDATRRQEVISYWHPLMRRVREALNVQEPMVKG